MAIAGNFTHGTGGKPRGQPRLVKENVTLYENFMPQADRRAFRPAHGCFSTMPFTVSNAVNQSLVTFLAKKHFIYYKGRWPAHGRNRPGFFAEFFI